jgi:hypothetical protein
MTTTSPLHSYMQGLLRHAVEGAHNSEVVIDNAIIPTRSLRMKQRRRRARPTRCYSSSAFPESSNSKSCILKSNSTRRGVNTVLHSIDNEGFQCQRPSKKLSSLELSSQEQATLSPLSPRSARWSPTTRPTLVRQKSDTALNYPKRIIDSPRTKRDYL